ncbi:hypothetical protein [Pedobacter heparinus]|uniref:hypothetical protein n=1 Tax=Pedobacter heparinus TaxID=984 RepID=UPI00292EA655|nr:hypothetical protein [Pedobacter heparinus]
MSQLVISPELIHKYIRGGCSPDERNAVEQWYHSLKERSGSAMEMELKHQLESKMWLLGRIRTNMKNSSTENRNRRMKVLLYCWLVCLVAVSLFLFWGLSKT